nr:unnamed protein product [Digitaria exilis]
MRGTSFSGAELPWWMLLPLPLVLASPPQVNAAEERVVTHLPGFEGPLPFDFRTGYVEVDESNGVRLFYYFALSERSPADDPVMLWLSGGPGCTSFTGLVYQIGPLKFDRQGYKDGLPKLVYRSESWTKWFEVHPEFLSNPLYIGGDSYSGMIVPTVTSEITKDVNIDEPSKIPFAHRMGLISDHVYEEELRCGG